MSLREELRRCYHHSWIGTLILGATCRVSSPPGRTELKVLAPMEHYSCHYRRRETTNLLYWEHAPVPVPVPSLIQTNHNQKDWSLAELQFQRKDRHRRRKRNEKSHRDENWID